MVRADTDRAAVRHDLRRRAGDILEDQSSSGTQVFIVLAGVMLAPVIHIVLHRFHLEGRGGAARIAMSRRSLKPFDWPGGTRMSNERISRAGWIAIGLGCYGSLVAIVNEIAGFRSTGAVDRGHIALIVGVPAFIYAIVSNRKA